MKYITWEEILSNPMWTPLLAFLAILTVTTTIVIFLLSRKNKRFAYDILSNNPVLLKEDEVEGTLEILHNKNPVKDVYLSVIKLINSGNVEIKTDDFYKPVIIDFGDNTKVLTTEISDGINAPLKIHDNTVIVKPTLLNKSDYIIIKSLVSNFSDDNKITFGGRIVGVKEIKKYVESKIHTVILSTGLLFYVAGVISMFATQDILPLGLPLFSIGIFLILTGVLTSKDFKKVIYQMIEIGIRKSE